MSRLSSSIEDIQPHYTVVVIGSGYGGGIAASRLARAGQSVCVLERGKEFQPGEYPDTELEALPEIQMNLPDRTIGVRTGLYDIRISDDMNVLVGCGLGGTSLINANVASGRNRASSTILAGHRRFARMSARSSHKASITPKPCLVQSRIPPRFPPHLRCWRTKNQTAH